MLSYFNLIDEPWIPCYVEGDERPKLLSLFQVFLDAKNIRTIYTQTPLETIALYRLLLVILHCAAQGPKTKEAWCRLWNNGWEYEVTNYLNNKYDRFFLFDQKYPFFQAPNLVSKEEDPENGLNYWPITGITFNKASNNNPTIWDHNTDDQSIEVSLDVAARWLVSQQLFNLGAMKSGKKAEDKSSSDSPTTRHMHFLIRGKNLFETLMYNLCLYNIDADKPFVGQSSDDKPCWEQDLKFDSHQKEVLGYLDYMTWQPNWIKLKFNKNNPRKVSKVLVSGGYKFEPLSDDIPRFDPLCMYYRIDTKTKKLGWEPYKMKRERSVWRDLNALFPISDGSTNNSSSKIKEIKRPSAIELFANLMKSDLKLPKIKYLPIDIYGVSTQPGQNKIHLWRQETYSIPLDFITKPDEAETALLIKYFNYSITRSEKIARTLIRSLRILIGKDVVNSEENTEKTRKKTKENIKPYSDSLEENQKLFCNALSVYWANLSISFQSFIAELTENRKQAINNWENEIRIAAFKALDFASQGYEESGQALKRVSLAQIMLQKLLKKSGKEGQAGEGTTDKSIH